mmetsp:Transcript_1857/g.2163  ORF Transcript_1857/g.2163 Transcript_1857/m.2163 type:complete len:316 (+) Transcript_1857:405-1352(+)
MELNLPALTRPQDVDVSDTLNFEIWKLDMRDYRDKTKKRDKNNAKAFALILGQCSRAVRDRIEASSTWQGINDESDVIGLLKLIRQSIFTGATTRKKGQSLANAELAFYRFRQGDRMSNSEFLEKFKGLVEVVEHFGGAVGQSDERINEHTDTPLQPEEREQAKMKAKDAHLAMLLISMSDPKRYGQLAADLENEHTRGTDGYPTTVTAAYDMLVNYRTPNTPKFQPQDSGMAFYIEAGSQGGRGRGDRGGRSNAGRGRGGGRGRGYVPNSEYNGNNERSTGNSEANTNSDMNDQQGHSHYVDNSDDNYNGDINR